MKSTLSLQVFALGIVSTASMQGSLLFYEGFGEGMNDTELATESSDPRRASWFPVEVPGGFSFPEYQRRYYAPQPGDVSYYYPPNVELPYAPGATQRLNEYGNSIHQHGLKERNIDMAKDGVYFISFLLRSFMPDSDGEATVSLVGPSNAVHIGYRFSDRFTIATSAWNEMAFQGKFVDSPDKFPGNETYFIVAMVEARARGEDKISLKAYRSANEAVTPDPARLSGTGTDLAQWTVVSSLTSNEVFDRIGINTTGLGYFTLDEIRVGTTWHDVTGLHP